MKAVVFAYNNIGCIGIEQLVKAGVIVQAVFTHADDPNENLWFRSVAETAAALGIPVFAPEDVNHPLWTARIKKMAPDFIFSFYYRKVIGKDIISIPKKGAFNLHGSLLPKYRGCAPLNWAVINGEKESGVTLHKMTEKVDAGDIVAQEKFAIADSDTAKDAHLNAAAAAEKMLKKVLPSVLAGKAKGKKQDEKQATYFGRRCPANGLIDWTKDAASVRNLVRGVTRPFPGAFTFIAAQKYYIWDVKVVPLKKQAQAGTIVSTAPFVIACGKGAVQVNFAQKEGGLYTTGEQLAADNRFTPKMLLTNSPVVGPKRKKSVLILGVNGFIGNAISQRLLADGNYEVYGMDLRSGYITDLLSNPDFHFFEGDVQINHEWIEYHVRKCDVVLPLVAIATPIEYTRNPLRVFELDFEENLKIVRYCAKYNKRIIFPSTFHAGQHHGKSLPGQRHLEHRLRTAERLDRERTRGEVAVHGLRDAVMRGGQVQGNERRHGFRPARGPEFQEVLAENVRGRELFFPDGARTFQHEIKPSVIRADAGDHETGVAERRFPEDHVPGFEASRGHSSSSAAIFMALSR